MLVLELHHQLAAGIVAASRDDHFAQCPTFLDTALHIDNATSKEWKSVRRGEHGFNWVDVPLLRFSYRPADRLRIRHRVEHRGFFQVAYRNWEAHRAGYGSHLDRNRPGYPFHPKVVDCFDHCHVAMFV